MKIVVAGTDVDIAPEMKSSLQSLIKNPSKNQAKIKDIGEELNSIGGFQCMQDFYAFCDLSPGYGASVQIAWNGIGEWEY